MKRVSWLVLMLLPAMAEAGDADGLDLAVRSFFLSPSEPERQKWEREILATAGLTVERLTDVIRRVPLWEPQPTGDREITLHLGRDPGVDMPAWIHVPAGYTPDRRWPVLITLHGASGHARSIFQYTLNLLGDRAADFIVVAPDRFTGIAFSMPSSIVGRPRALVNAVRRRFRVDSDRVYLMGYSMGGSNTWMGTVMHADCFAGAVPLANFLQIVGGTALWDQVLPNCRHTAILFCWGENDTLDAHGDPDRQGGIARMSRRMASLIDDLDFERFQAFELPGVGHAGVAPPVDAWVAMLERRRPHYPRSVRQAFRLADQSQAYWVAAAQSRGRPLPSGELRIEMKPHETWPQAKRRYLTGRLGVIEATCHAQTITLQTRRTAELVLLLSDELVDLDRPVVVERDGRTVFNGLVSRDLRVTLTEAARTWDFERLPCARAVISYAGSIEFGYPVITEGRDRRRRGHRGG